MKKILLLVCIIGIIGLLMPMLALASYNYYIPIEVYNNNSEGLTGVPILVTLNNSQLVDLGYISSSGLDTDLQEGSTQRPYLVADARLGVFLPSLLGYQTKTVNYRLGEDPPQESFSGIILGGGGYFTVEGSDGLDLGNAFIIEFIGWINTTYSSDVNVVYKEDAFRIYIQAEDTIRAAILGAGDSEVKNVTVSDLDSGIMKVEVEADSTNMTIDIWDGTGTYLGGDLVDLGATVVPDNENTWYFMQNNSVAYLEYLKFYV